MTQQKKSIVVSLQDKFVRALIQVQKIPGMDEVLQPSINALKDTSRILVPENDYNNIALFTDLIFKHHRNKIQTADDRQNIQLLINLAALSSQHNIQTLIDLNFATNPTKKKNK